jgi:hypothetical protein
VTWNENTSVRQGNFRLGAMRARIFPVTQIVVSFFDAIASGSIGVQ